VAYKPNFDTSIATVTRSSRQTTVHTDYIDWDNYPFDDPKHTGCMSCDDAGKAKRIEEQKQYLKTCETNEPGTYASDYGGWPRIWQKVLRVGMVSAWPYWEPRPCVLVDGTLGAHWIDWMSLTGAYVKEQP